MNDPVDGFAVECEEQEVLLTLSNRYGSVETYRFDRPTAYRIGRALMDCSEDDPQLDQYG